MKCFFSAALIFISGTTLKAQQVNYFPVQFGQFFNTYAIINPASCGSKASLEIQLGRQQHGGAWKNIATSFASCSFRINKAKLNKFQVGGLSFIGDKEGEYLKRSKFSVNYAWHTKLTQKLSLSAGASAGFFSFLVSGSSANVSGGATAPDASIGIWLYSENYYLGGSVNQMLNSKLTPIEETTKLVRHYNVTGGYTVLINKSFILIPRTLLRYAPGYPLDVNVSVVSVTSNILSIGVNYRHHNSIVPLIGFEKLVIGKGNLKAMFSYSIPAGRTANYIQTYELIVNYHFKPDKKKR